MKRLIVLGLLALPSLMATGSTADAQCSGPGCAGGRGASPVGAFWGCSHAGCGGFCFKFLGGIHQHGPLFNYGPYQGYYPFQPYGPWTSDLRYTGPHGDAGAYANGCGLCGGLLNRFGACGKCGGGILGKLRGGCGDGGCGWGEYSKHTFRNVFHRLHPCAHKCGAECCLDGGCATQATECSTCGNAGTCTNCTAGSATVNTSTAATTAAPSELQLTGYPRTER